MTTTHTTHTSAPLELLGVHPGISVIDPATVLARLWYFDGKFLRAEGFRREQEYVRSLVALSNRATGNGVVHGFDVETGDGDTLRIDGGLALSRSGRVVHLPSGVALSVSELVARSFGEVVAGRRANAGDPDSAAFGRCAAETPGDPITTVPTRPVYLLTVAATEALCGEEERLGQLCETACATETDRELAIEGVRFRLRELNLRLPVSDRQPFDETHLRSRVATAYFEQERTEVGSLISGAGLRAGTWCHGTEGVDGEEVPLAVLGRTASGGTWLDMWTARRELVEQSPQRYWGWRMAMRPLDVFLAQVLQFQCQLTDDAPSGPGGASGGHCEDERDALAETRVVLESILASREDAAERTAAALSHVAGLSGRLDALRVRIGDVLSKTTSSPSGSLLLDAGMVTLPSGGYLPVDPNRPVEGQVRALMGPGVDLRFCAVRADFVPEALQEAQHMERISLTQGVGHPDRLEDVDVLVPGGLVAAAAPAMNAFEGLLRVLPSVRAEEGDETRGSVLILSVVGRDQLQDGWSWSLAGHGEAPSRLSLANLASAFARAMGYRSAEPAAEEGAAVGAAPPAEAEAAPAAPLPVDPDEAHERLIASAAFRQRLARDATFARERLERLTGAGFFEEVPAAAAVLADRPIAPGEKRPVVAWFDGETDKDLRDVAVGGRTAYRMRLTAYSRASGEPLLFDGKFTGSLVVTAKTTTAMGGKPVLDIRTDVEGFFDTLIVAEGNVQHDPPESVDGRLKLRWTVSLAQAFPRLLAVDLDSDGGRVFRFETSDGGAPRHVRAVLSARLAREIERGRWSAITMSTAIGPREAVLGDIEMDESPGALEIGAPGRELVEGVIDVLASELSVRGHDTGFAAVARRRFFEADRSGDQQVRATTDWVMFHRRRTKDCGQAAPPSVPSRRLRWFHAVMDSPDDLKNFATLAGRWERAAGAARETDLTRVRERVDGLGFEIVTTLDFPLGSATLLTPGSEVRAAWSAQPRGTHLRAGVVASLPTGDGSSVDLARLSAATSAVAGLVDATGMQTTVTSEIPPEFQAVGIDGALFTVGFERKQVETTRILLARGAFIRRDEDPPEISEDPMTLAILKFHFGDSLDVMVGEWDGDTLRNGDVVLDWWSHQVAEKGEFFVSEEIVEQGQEAHVGSLLERLAESFGTPQFDGNDRTWSDDDTVAAVIFFVPDQ